MMAKHRLMMNIDKDLYEWLRDRAHKRRSSMSRIIAETLETARLQSDGDLTPDESSNLVGAGS